jgi:hypothetical protein
MDQSHIPRLCSGYILNLLWCGLTVSTALPTEPVRVLDTSWSIVVRSGACIENDSKGGEC